jgi:hypothetical protein
MNNSSTNSATCKCAECGDAIPADAPRDVCNNAYCELCLVDDPGLWREEPDGDSPGYDINGESAAERYEMALRECRAAGRF